MYISKFTINNYKSYFDSGELKFKSGINIIVGENNSGKTALLESLSHDFDQVIHQSVKVKPLASSRGNVETAFATFCVVLEPEEISEVLLHHEFDYFVTNLKLEDHDLLQEVTNQNLTSKMEVFIKRGKCYLFQFGNYSEESSIQSRRSLIYRRISGTHYVLDDPANTKFAHSIRTPSMTLGEKIAKYVLSHVYMFRAERASTGISSIGVSRELTSNAENLPEVLNSVKTNNTFLFQQYLDLVREVIPSINDISVEMREIGELNALNYQIKVWNLPKHSQREDLAVPIAQSGTGVSQVLSLLFITLINQNQPKIIIIDEPNSFLHPMAAKQLIQIFNRFPRHQYFISTHSPEIVSAAKPTTITRTKLINGETKIDQFDSTDTSQIQNTFQELGISPSDFFFSDKILWVEGETEEKAFPAILNKIGIERWTVLSVMPSEIRNKKKARKNTKNVFKIYQQLSGSDALIHSTIAVVLDREDYGAEDIRDDIKEFGDSLHFLPRKMFENYLLEPEAICAVYNGTAIDDAPKTTVEQIDQWIEKNKDHEKYKSKSIVGEQIGQNIDWRVEIDGAKFLSDLFNNISEFKNPYYKTTHSVMLSNWLVEYNFEHLAELTTFLLEIFQSSSAI